MRARAEWSRALATVTLAGIAAGLLAGCPTPGFEIPPPDPNAPAEYLGSATCLACHSNIRDMVQLHGHAQALTLTQGAAPSSPAGAGVPAPPVGFDWADIDYVIGGYTKAANFVDTSGFVLTDGTAGTPTQYNLVNVPARLDAGFVPFRADQTTPLPYEFNCFRCHTTGAAPVTLNGGRRQGNRPGIGGTWAEEGVQCEACHGPGSKHVPDPSAGNILLATAAQSCQTCHSNPDGTGTFAAADGFIVGNQQAAEVAASPHRDFTCTTCHDPHASVVFDRERGLRNPCTSCHAYQNMAGHEGRVYTLGSYVEPLSCESCHMPLASKNASSTFLQIDASERPVGDTRTHIMYIGVQADATLFTPDGVRVATDATGRAAVPVRYVCLRCHHGVGSAFGLTEAGARTVADGIHALP